MEIGGWPNGRAQDEGDNVDELNYGVLEEDGPDVRLVDNTNTPPHLRAVVDEIEYKGVDALRRALDVLNSMNIDINEAVEDGDTALRRGCFHGELSCGGASLDVKDGCEGIPRLDTCLGVNKEVVQHLFSAARSPHIIERMLETVESELGDTPLHHAAGADRSEVMRVMLELTPIGETRNGQYVVSYYYTKDYRM